MLENPLQAAGLQLNENGPVQGLTLSSRGLMQCEGGKRGAQMRMCPRARRSISGTREEDPVSVCE